MAFRATQFVIVDMLVQAGAKESQHNPHERDASTPTESTGSSEEEWRVGR